jgi:hypothetical protein
VRNGSNRKEACPVCFRDINERMGSGIEEVANSSVLGRISVGIAFFYFLDICDNLT